MIFENETPLPGSKCNNMADPIGGLLCGKPAVLLMIPINMPNLEEDDRMLLCEECRVERLRRNAQADQDGAFEEHHGWPRDMDILDLAHSMGSSECRFQKLLDMNAPTIIIKSERRILIRREERILSWLEAHAPSGDHDTHLQAINALITSFNEQASKDPSGREYRRIVHAGLKRVRELGSLVDEEALKPR